MNHNNNDIYVYMDSFLLPLNKGLFTRISASRYAEIAQLRLRSCWNPCTRSFYVVTDIKTVNGWRSIQLSRLILGLPYGDRTRIADHINHDTLDNRDENLRVVTRSQNMWNMRKKATNKSGYKGVSFCKKTGLWRVNICVFGRCRNLGRYETPELGYAAYCKAAEELHGEFRCLL